VQEETGSAVDKQHRKEGFQLVGGFRIAEWLAFLCTFVFAELDFVF